MVDVAGVFQVATRRVTAGMLSRGSILECIQAFLYILANSENTEMLLGCYAVYDLSSPIPAGRRDLQDGFGG